ncbi:MAG: hypothetical protein KKH84_06555 [Proteobacteria bacterium]|nr:hypothetical protein [Pseudomonadota bacterium]MBU4388842.1 hypothetical protein [Pseudomonadota bacterium]MBU4420651.1 hypothetical protein [Pseudomonadota bacterium]
MSLTFEQLISSIRHVHDQLAAQAGRAVNISLTLRNWAIGHYIHEYEQNGSDLAQYGERLLDRLAEQLQKSGLKRVESRELRRYRQFYQLYPQIRESVTPELNRLLLGGEFPLSTEKWLVEYALAGMDNNLFVSKYQLELPKKEEMQRFLAQQMKEVGCGE